MEGVLFDQKHSEEECVHDVTVTCFICAVAERAFREVIHRDGRNLQVLAHLQPYKLQSNYPQAPCECACARDLASHCPLFLCSFDDVAREYTNSVVKASEKKTGFNQSAFQESFSEETERLLLKSFISKGMTLSLGRHHIFSHTLQRI